MKRKIAATVAGLSVLVAALAGATYMWFFSQRSVATGNGNAAYIDLLVCREQTITFDNVLPGEPISFGTTDVKYYGSRDAIIQFKLVGTGTLQPGSEFHSDWLALNPSIIASDYYLDGTVYRYTDKRLNEILALTPINPKYYTLYPSATEPNTYYMYITADESEILNLVKAVQLKFTGEFGGGYRGGNPTASPSRQFEQESTFEATGLRITAVQVTEEAVRDVLGAAAASDVQDMLDAMVAQGGFTIPAEWTYTG